MIEKNFEKTIFSPTPFPSTRPNNTEDNSIKRHYQSTLISGFWFYYCHIFKLFTIMSFWRFINKPKNMTDSPYQLGAFVFLLLGANIGLFWV